VRSSSDYELKDSDSLKNRTLSNNNIENKTEEELIINIDHSE
jgi:hypothetical protein